MERKDEKKNNLSAKISQFTIALVIYLVLTTQFLNNTGKRDKANWNSNYRGRRNISPMLFYADLHAISK